MDDKTCYCIELNKTKLEISILEGHALGTYLEAGKVKNCLELNNNDFKVFLKYEEAEDYFKKFKKILDSIKEKNLVKKENLPCMAIKRHYIVQAILNEKMNTKRTYLKAWNIGQEIYIEDQKNFLKVRINNIIQVNKSLYQYDFELA